MSLDEIRVQKGLILLEYKEAEAEVEALRVKLSGLSRKFDDLAKLLSPSESARPLDLERIRNLGTEETMSAAQSFNEALKRLGELQKKKGEFGLS